MSAPSPAPAGYILRVANVSSVRLHLCHDGTAAGLCGVVCAPAPPSAYALRWGHNCPGCAKVLAGTGKPRRGPA